MNTLPTIQNPQLFMIESCSEEQRIRCYISQIDNNTLIYELYDHNTDSIYELENMPENILTKIKTLLKVPRNYNQPDLTTSEFTQNYGNVLTVQSTAYNYRHSYEGLLIWIKYSIQRGIADVAYDKGFSIFSWYILYVSPFDVLYKNCYEDDPLFGQFMICFNNNHIDYTIDLLSPDFTWKTFIEEYNDFNEADNEITFLQHLSTHYSINSQDDDFII